MNRREFLQAVYGVLGGAALTPALAGTGSRRAVTPERIGTNLPLLGVSIYDALATVERLGFSTVEVATWGAIRPPKNQAPGIVLADLDQSDRQRVRAAFRRFKHRSVHLPFAGLVVVGKDRELVARSRQTMEQALETAAFLEVEFAVIHCLPPRGVPRKQGWAELLDLYRKWGDRARKLGFRLGVETGYPGSVAEFTRFVQELDHPQIGATIDVGHQIHYPEFRKRFGKKVPNTPEAYRAYNDVLHLLVEQLGEKLWHFHIHDIDPSIWREHKPLTHGVIDYRRLFRTLAERSFNGLLVFEIAVVPGADMAQVLADSRATILRSLGS